MVEVVLLWVLGSFLIHPFIQHSGAEGLRKQEKPHLLSILKNKTPPNFFLTQGREFSQDFSQFFQVLVHS